MTVQSAVEIMKESLLSSVWIGDSEGLTPSLVVDVSPDDGVPVAPVSDPVEARLHVVRDLPQHGDLTLAQENIGSLPNWNKKQTLSL